MQPTLKHIGGSLYLKGNFLHTKRVYYYSDGTQKTEEKKIPLVKVTPSQCLEKRRSGMPGIIFKRKGGLYWADIKSKSNFNLGNHLCFGCANFARCAKIMDAFPETDRYEMQHCRIEKYPFIIEGFDRFNQPNEGMVVSECINHVVAERKIFSPEEVRRRKFNLVTHLIPDAESLEQAHAIIKRDRFL